MGKGLERKRREVDARIGNESTGETVPHWKTLKTHVVLPVYRHIMPHTLTSLLNLAQAFDPSKITFGIFYGAYIEHSRNNLAELSMREGADRVLFVDGDMGFEVEDYIRLHEQLDKDPGMGMISAMYSGHQDTNWLIVGWMNEDGTMWLEDDCQLRGLEMIRDKKIEEVDKAGGGFMLINREVFEKVPPLWFATMPELGGFMGEDVYFIQLLKHNGFRPSVDGGVVVTHIGPTSHKPVFDEATKKRYKALKGLQHKRRSQGTNKEVSN